MATETHVYRILCTCGREMCSKDKKSIDMMLRLHRKKCVDADQKKGVSNIHYDVGKERHKDLPSLGAKLIRDFDKSVYGF